MMTPTFTRLNVFIALTLTLLFFSTAYAEEKPVSANDPATSAETTNSPSGETDSSTTEESAVNEDNSAMDSATQEAPEPKPDVNRRIARAQFTTAIVDREPTDNIVMFTNDNDKIYFFTELVNFNGQNVKHRWEYEGKEMAVVDFKVEGARWRIHSSKNIKPEWIGAWSVIVFDENDRPLKVTSFEVVDANTGN
jgi:hypothetical protein